MKILEKQYVKLNQSQVSSDVLNTLLKIATAKGLSFSSEQEICNYLNREYKLAVSVDDIANLFYLDRVEEDMQIYLQNINY